MARTSVLLSVLIVGLLAVTGLSGADRKDAGPRGRGALPPHWNRLGLTDDQKQQLYDTQGEYRAKIEDLQRQISKLKKQQLADMAKVLTPAQKARLHEILLEKSPSDTTVDKNDKPPALKSPDKDK
jgi:Spy/CpxP family protein refolding chaperone